ncbi:MAG: glycosyltransferase family 39 protein [Planctomycetota bacterium]|nr:glycosyltransferase family 39 protein [Planctomycetota bacterium]
MIAPQPEDRTGRTWTFLAVGIGLVLRLVRPEVHSFWIDEGMTVRIARAADPFAMLCADSHPPLVFLLVRAWMRAFGEQDWILRLLPAFVSCAALGLFVPLARAWLGRKHAAWAIALYAVSPLLVWYAHEVRMYAFLECSTLLVLLAARRAWAAPSAARWIGLAFATAVATGFHYYGALAGLVVIAQAAASGARSTVRTGIASTVGVLAWTPWLVMVLPIQRSGSWPVIVQASPRDLAELPARLLAVDFAVLVDHGVPAIGWVLGGLCLAAFIAGCLRALARRAPREIDAALAALIPISAAGLLACCARGGFQPRYLTPAIPGAIACIAAGLVAWTPALPGRAACAVLLLCATTMTGLQLSENRREDYRTATAEIRERWRPGDRLLLLVCVPESQIPSTVDHYLRDRPDILASQLDPRAYMDGVDRPPSGTRIHVLWREATICLEPMHRLETSHAILERSAARFRIHRLLTAVP